MAPPISTPDGVSPQPGIRIDAFAGEVPGQYGTGTTPWPQGAAAGRPPVVHVDEGHRVGGASDTMVALLQRLVRQGRTSVTVVAFDPKDPASPWPPTTVSELGAALPQDGGAR